MGAAMKESNTKMEAAQKSGDPGAQAQAAMQGLGALFGGGKRVDPIGIAELKPFVPATFAGLEKTGGSAEKNGMAGLAVSKAEGIYSDHAQKHVTLEITDSGGASGLIGMAGWMNLQGEREDDNGFEKTEKVDGRLMHEKGSKRPGGDNEFTVVLADRFIVAAHGSVDLPALEGGRVGTRPRQARSDEVSRRRQVARRAPGAGPPRDGRRTDDGAAGADRGQRARQAQSWRRMAPASSPSPIRTSSVTGASAPQGSPKRSSVWRPARSRKPRRGSPARWTKPLARTSAVPQPLDDGHERGSASSGAGSL